MAVSAPIDWSTVENALVAWVENATGLTCVWSSQATPVPAYPFARLKLIAGPGGTGATPDERWDTDLGEAQGEEVGVIVAEQVLCTYSLQVETSSDAPGASANEYVGRARAAAWLPSYLEAFKAAGVGLLEVQATRDLDQAEGQIILSRAVADVRVCLAANLTERTGYIDVVSAEGTLTDPAGNETTVLVDVEAS